MLSHHFIFPHWVTRGEEEEETGGDVEPSVGFSQLGDLSDCGNIVSMSLGDWVNGGSGFLWVWMTEWPEGQYFVGVDGETRVSTRGKWPRWDGEQGEAGG